MIQAAKIIGTGITDYPEFFITFLLVDLYLFIYLYYPLAHVSVEFKIGWLCVYLLVHMGWLQ